MPTKTAMLAVAAVVVATAVAAVLLSSPAKTPGRSALAAGRPPAVSPEVVSAAGDPLKLPRIAWDGGPAYWNRFPLARADGWSSPKFFPIVAWFDTVSSDAEVRGDESYGFNTYIGEPTAVNYYNFADTRASVLTALGNTPRGGPAMPGLFLADEPDSGPTSAYDLAKVRKLEAAAPKDGRFDAFNFSANVLANSDPAVNRKNFEAIVNSYAGPVSVDKYYYSNPSCFDIRYLIVKIDPGHCRTSSSYGATVRAVTERVEAGGGKLKPVWNFIEELGGGPPGGTFTSYIKPGQIEGAVMDSIINGATGIEYFNQSFDGTCQGGNIIRQVQTGTLPCARPQLDAVKQVDQRILALAPVINTQSYQYAFGPDLDTMLKTYRGSAYIFAMINGAKGSEPGKRTFTLPPALAHAARVQVLNENRTLPVSGGKFTDYFPREYTYHLYKVTM